AGIRVIKAFNRIKYTIRRYYHAMVTYYKTGQATYFMQIAADQVRVSPIHIIWPMSLPFFAYLGLKGTIPIITWGSIIYFSRALLYYLDGTYKFFQKFRLYLVPANRLFDTLDIEPAITDSPDAKSIDDLQGHVQFEHVDFSYQPGHPILRDILFEVPPGKKVAIVGPSGAGKSTLAMLLMRLYKADSGDIKIDGRSVADIKMHSVLSQTGVILQDTFLFGGTIRDNIRYADPKASDEQIEEAAKAAGLHDDIINMPQGYDTDVAEGASLSGGQKQRVAIARALLKNPKFLILDEATSSLDVTTEWAVMQTLRENFADVTTLIISHRLNTIVDADEIIVIDKGSIIEQGTHEQLLKKRGFYNMLYQQQSDILETEKN
ncbi:ATP-binding cassette domain-containing protein, partial [candidate division KSB1 bacterium]|nr:ATP-binding cassette domain-containing protein [candidate division KSB1 bacterium]